MFNNFAKINQDAYLFVKENNYNFTNVDWFHIFLIRKNIENFLTYCNFKDNEQNFQVLNIGCGEVDFKNYFHKNTRYDTLDINPRIQATYTADITNTNNQILKDLYDVVLCIEVLEHVTNPFLAIKEIHRIVKPQGNLVLSVPFNFRIHEESEFFRYTANGLKLLLKDYFIINEFVVQSDPHRGDLMPLGYILKATKQ